MFRFLFFACIAGIGLAGCGKSDAPATAPAQEAAPARTALQRTPSADGARVFFLEPEDGAVVKNPVRIRFGVEGMSIVKAGDNRAHSGHHHLLIDTGLPDLSLPIPADDRHIHFGDGSVNTDITLAPGSHTLQMLLGDHLHIPHDPPLTSDRISITVEE